MVENLFLTDILKTYLKTIFIAFNGITFYVVLVSNWPKQLIEYKFSTKWI